MEDKFLATLKKQVSGFQRLTSHLEPNLGSKRGKWAASAELNSRENTSLALQLAVVVAPLENVSSYQHVTMPPESIDRCTTYFFHRSYLDF